MLNLEELQANIKLIKENLEPLTIGFNQVLICNLTNYLGSKFYSP